MTPIRRRRTSRGPTRNRPASTDRPVLWRLAALVCVVLHLAVAALAPLADSRQDTAPAHTAHVEAAGTEGCLPSHDHDACQFCLTIRSSAGPLPSACPDQPAALAEGSGLRSTSAKLRSSRALGPFGARAPPIL